VGALVFPEDYSPRALEAWEFDRNRDRAHRCHRKLGKAEASRESENLRSAILDSVTHESELR